MDAIVINKLGKAYKEYQSKWGRLLEWISPIHKKRHRLKWILNDINFTVKKGEAIGIVGKNGAGKSTLLKMITGTTEPTSGNIIINGRIAALLELGMGFDPDFTGRQNVIMAAQLQGLNKNEISALMSDIEEFADIGEYIDQPLRTYSSGMQARLAFSVATCVKPDILIVDEALSVGDIAFQAKCMQRMNRLLKNGVTILFVSHSLNQIRQFCSKAIYIKNGRCEKYGNATDVCDLFQNDLLGLKKSSTLKLDNSDSNHKMLTLNDSTSIEDPFLRKYSLDEQTGSLELQFIRFEILDEEFKPIATCSHNQEINIRAYIKANSNVDSGISVGLLFADKTGYPLLACNSNYYDCYLPSFQSGEVAVIHWKIRMPIANGELRIDIGMKPDVHGLEFFDRVFCAKTITIKPSTELLKRNFGGYLYTDAEISVNKN